MKLKLINALLSVSIVAVLGLLTWVVSVKIQDYQANQRQSAAQQASRQEFERQMATAATSTTIPAETAPATVPVTTTTVPRTTATVSTVTTTTVPATTTTTVPSPEPPARESIPVNAPFGQLQIPVIGLDQIVARADEADHGHKALEGGVAWFPSSSRYTADLSPTNNLAMPGEGGNVAIGGHRGGSGRSGVFGRLHQLKTGDEVVVITAWGKFTYRVTVPCPDGDQSHCTLSDEEILGHFAGHESSVETLFLFSCDGRKRIYVVAELVSAEVG